MVIYAVQLLQQHQGVISIYFILVNDYSQVMWVYMLKNKDEIFNVFKNFRAQVENRSERKIQVFKTDRGGEFFLMSLLPILKKPASKDIS